MRSAELEKVEFLDLGGHRVDAHAQEVVHAVVAEATDDQLDRLGDTSSNHGEIGATMRAHHLDVEADAARGGRERPVGEGAELRPTLGLQRELDLQARPASSAPDDEVELVTDVLPSVVGSSAMRDPQCVEAVGDGFFQLEPSLEHALSMISHETSQ